jgi:hypothetical protein
MTIYSIDQGTWTGYFTAGDITGAIKTHISLVTAKNGGKQAKVN